MIDPFDVLRDELVRAAERATAAGSGHGIRRRRWWRGRQSLALVLAAVLMVGGAATAATLLSGEQSKSLSGVVPPGQQPHTALVAGQRYTIAFAPSIQAGQIGWCVSTRTFTPSGRAQDQGTGGCNTPAVTAGQPVLGTQTIVNGGGLSYVFTSGAVRAIRIAGGPTVLTRPDSRLPDGYRAAVFQYRPPKGALGLVRIPGGGAHLISALSSSGEELTQDSSGPPVEPTRSWLYPDAHMAGVCSLSAKPGSRLRTGSGSVLTTAIPAPTITGHAFLPCIDEDLYLPQTTGHSDAAAGADTSLVAAILLDAAHPGATPGPLPGMHRTAARDGIYDMPHVEAFAGSGGSGLTATRTANGWLVVAGGSSAAQRAAALHALIPQVHLSSVTPPAASTPSALCQISYRPISGLQETTHTEITSTRRIAPAVAASQARAQHQLTAALAKQRLDQAAHPHDQALLVSDRAAVSLLQQANVDAFQQDSGLFAPDCAQATFYYRQHWPMTATMILTTKDCPGRRRPVPCSQKAAAQRAMLTKATQAVPGYPDEFSVAPTAFFHPAETVKHINNWWLVVQGGANQQQRQLLLDQLDTKVTARLRASLPTASLSPATFCARENPTAC